MQPNYPQQYAAPAPQYPAPPAAPQYPPAPQYPAPAQYPAAPVGYPPAPQYPAQYPVAPGYPAGYGAPAAPPVPPSAPGSLDGFYGQPSQSSGPSFKFKGADGLPQIGKTYVGVVARPLTDGDVRQATDNNGVPQAYKDGRPKFIMIVPMRVQPSPEFPEGEAGWWVKGDARDRLVQAMAEAGAPAGPPEAGAMIQVTLTGTRPIPNMSPKYLYRVVYTRPTGAPAQAVAATPPAEPVRPEAGAYPAPAPQYAPEGYAGQVAPGYPVQYAPQPAQPVYAAPAPQYAPQVPPASAPPAYVAQAAPPAQFIAPVAPPGVPAAQAMHAVAAGQPAPVAQAPSLTAEQQALMATLVGQPA